MPSSSLLHALSPTPSAESYNPSESLFATYLSGGLLGVAVASPSQQVDRLLYWRWYCSSGELQHLDFIWLTAEHAREKVTCLGWTEVVPGIHHLIVGFGSGRVSLYTHKGALCLSAIWHPLPVIAIRSTRGARNVGSSDGSPTSSSMMHGRQPVQHPHATDDSTRSASSSGMDTSMSPALCAVLILYADHTLVHTSNEALRREVYSARPNSSAISLEEPPSPPLPSEPTPPPSSRRLPSPTRTDDDTAGVAVRDFRKVKLEDRGETSDVTVLALTGRALPSTDLSAIDMAYDAIQRAHRDGRRSSVAGAGGGGVEGYKPIMAYVAAGSDPYLSLHLRQPQEGSSPTSRTLVGSATSAASAVLSAAASWIVGGAVARKASPSGTPSHTPASLPPDATLSSKIAGEPTTTPSVRGDKDDCRPPLPTAPPDESLGQCREFADPTRRGTTMLPAPWNPTIAAVTDTFGRVVLVHLSSLQFLHIWKGYRDAQVAWGWTAQQTRRCLVLYAPRRGLLEIWDGRRLERLAAEHVGEGGRLLGEGEGILLVMPHKDRQMHVVQIPE